MQNISDMIEQFIISTLGEDPSLNLSRNYLAQHFNVAPSQINYVLSTRFNLNRGFVTESQRGGGGYIRLVRINLEGDDFLHALLNERIPREIGFKDAMYIVEDLVNKKYLTHEQEKIISYALHPKSLAMPIRLEDALRSQIFKNILANCFNKMENQYANRN